MRVIAVLIILLELVTVVVCNVLFFGAGKSVSERTYRVESHRLAREIQKQLEEKSDSPSDIPNKEIQAVIDSLDLSSYETIISVSLFDTMSISRYDYVVEETCGHLFRMEYEVPVDKRPVIFMNVGLGFMLLFTIILLVYVDRRISRPFVRMSDYADELAKGNLSTPVNQEKSRHFGRFLWGMDRLREQLETDREKEHEYMKERKTLLLSLSHDIKTPLSAIELYNKALSSGLYDTEEKRNDAYAGIEKNVADLKRYVDEITAASRQDFMVLDVKEGAFYLDEVLAQIETYYSNRFAVLHTQFEITDHGNPILKGDIDRVEEVFQNLLENAIKYGDGRRVWIDFSTEEDAQLIHVHNTGEGLPEGEEIHVFDSFYRGSNAEGKKGSGLGLYISRELIRKMDGEIYLEPGEGFSAVVVLRRA